MRGIGHFIGGKAVKGKSGRFGDVFDPNTGEVQAKVAFAARAEVEQVIANAEAAQPAWAATNPQRRARVMFKFLELIQKDVENLAKLPPLEQLRGQVLGAVTAPLYTIVGLFAAPLQNLVGLIDARIEQLKEQGDTSEAEASAAEAPAAAEAEAPASEDEAPAEAEPEAVEEEAAAPAAEAAADETTDTDTQEEE